MALLRDIRVLYHLVASPIRGKTHAERLESFYSKQAGAYDDFRKRLLQGREALYAAIDAPEHGVWADMGGGTGANLEFMGDTIDRLSNVYVVDLSPSLLTVARERIDHRGWEHVDTVEADVTTWTPPKRPNVVTFSYSLTMIPDWFAAIDHAYDILEPGGLVGVVDFFVARKHPEPGFVRHNWWTRAFWPTWFASDNVFLTPDHVPYLHRRFEVVHYSEHRAKVPYIPITKVPYYRFIGRKR